jgi:hypothetical protein
MRASCLNLHSAPRTLRLAGAVADPGFPGIQFNIADLQAAAHALGRQLVIVNAGTESDFRRRASWPAATGAPQ